MTLGVIASTLIDKIHNLPEAKHADKTLLVDHYIKLLPAADSYEKLVDMVIAKNLAVEGKHVSPLNKLQRYACLRKCAAVVNSDEEAKEIQRLIEDEKTRDYSDVDEIECLKQLGAVPLESDKMKLLNPIIEGTVPQSKLLPLVNSFYNHANPVQCKRLANLWLRNIERVESEQHRDYFEGYFLGLSPRFLKDAAITDELR